MHAGSQRRSVSWLVFCLHVECRRALERAGSCRYAPYLPQKGYLCSSGVQIVQDSASRGVNDEEVMRFLISFLGRGGRGGPNNGNGGRPSSGSGSGSRPNHRGYSGRDSRAQRRGHSRGGLLTDGQGNGQDSDLGPDGNGARVDVQPAEDSQHGRGPSGGEGSAQGQQDGADVVHDGAERPPEGGSDEDNDGAQAGNSASGHASAAA